MFAVKVEVTQSCLTLCDPMDTRLLHPWDFLGKSTGVGCHFLLQGILLTQGSNLCLLHWQADSLLLSHLGSPFQAVDVAYLKEPWSEEVS